MLMPTMEAEPSEMWMRLARSSKPSERELREALLKEPVPPDVRPDLWLKHSGAFRVSKRGVYAELLNSPERSQGEHAQIELDIGRSGVHDEEQQSSLRRVLRAYSTYRTSTGYVQGQNFIAAGLLRALPEEEAFWMLVVVVDKYLPEHFTHAMAGSFIDCRVLAELLARRLPDVSNHLAELDVSVQLLATRWFLSLWSSVLPPPTLLRVYDALFTLGPPTTLLVALACFHVMRPAILAAQHADELAFSTISAPLREAEPECLLGALLHDVGALTPRELERMRAKMRKDLQPAIPYPALAKRATLTASLQHEIRRMFKRPSVAVHLALAGTLRAGKASLKRVANLFRMRLT